MENKECSKCKARLPASTDFFTRDKTRSDGLYPTCKSCRKKLREKNKEKINKKKKEYYYKNRDEINEKRRLHRKNNPELYEEEGKKRYWKNVEENRKKSREYYYKNTEEMNRKSKVYYENNRNELRKQQRQYYNKNKTRLDPIRTKWRRENKERVYALNHARRVNERKVVRNFTNEQWGQAKEHFGNKCAYCGSESKLTRDHFVPISKGGDHVKENIVPACMSCNSSKQDRDFDEWYPTFERYSKQREKDVLEYLNYNKNKEQQLALF